MHFALDGVSAVFTVILSTLLFEYFHNKMLKRNKILKPTSWKCILRTHIQLKPSKQVHVSSPTDAHGMKLMQENITALILHINAKI